LLCRHPTAGRAWHCARLPSLTCKGRLRPAALPSTVHQIHPHTEPRPRLAIGRCWVSIQRVQPRHPSVQWDRHAESAAACSRTPSAATRCMTAKSVSCRHPSSRSSARGSYRVQHARLPRHARLPVSTRSRPIRSTRRSDLVPSDRWGLSARYAAASRAPALRGRVPLKGVSDLHREVARAAWPTLQASDERFDEQSAELELITKAARPLLGVIVAHGLEEVATLPAAQLELEALPLCVL